MTLASGHLSRAIFSLFWYLNTEVGVVPSEILLGDTLSRERLQLYTTTTVGFQIQRCLLTFRSINIQINASCTKSSQVASNLSTDLAQ